MVSKEKRLVNFLKAKPQPQVPIAKEMFLPNVSNVEDWARKDRIAASVMTALRLVATTATKALTTVANLALWIAGTTNQITVTDDGDGTITLSLPQNIDTGASPTFTGLTLSGVSDTHVIYSASGVLTGDADFTFTASSNSVKLTGWFNLGTTAKSTAQGDFATGIDDGNQMFYDQSTGILWLNTSDTNASAGLSNVLGWPGVSAATPVFFLYETDVAADQKAWALQGAGSTFLFQCVNDANSVANNVWKVTRSGAVPTTFIINEDSNDVDFRVESNGNANMFFVDGGSDNIGIGTATPNSTCLIDMNSTTKSLGLPVLTTTQRDAISSPKEGSLIFNTTTNKLNFYTGAAWEAVTSA